MVGEGITQVVAGGDLRPFDTQMRLPLTVAGCKPGKLPDPRILAAARWQSHHVRWPGETKHQRRPRRQGYRG